MSEPKPFEIAIVGGGIAGLTLAIALHARNVPVTVYEAAHHFGEIGAGVSFTPNAVQAMKVCHEGVYQAFEKVCTRNTYESKQRDWFAFYNGYAANQDEPVFTIASATGQNGVHRAHFLDELIKLFPAEMAHFGKRLESIVESPSGNGRLQMRFRDGTTAEADAIVGCDGIKSEVRQVIVGKDHPSAHPQYTNKYCYRGLIPMDKAVEAVGDEKARNSCLYTGPDAHVLTFNIDGGATLNVVAFVATSHPWPGFTHLTQPAHRSQALADFAGWGPDVTSLLNLVNPDLDIWAIFDTGTHPVPTFVHSTLPIAVSGDAAHATSPHHGAGAGMCIEDAAVLAAILSADGLTKDGLHTALKVFDHVRRDRGHGLVQSSRLQGELYEWRADSGKDWNRMKELCETRNGVIHDVNVEKMCGEAREELDRWLNKE